MSTEQAENFETSVEIPEQVTVSLKKNMLGVTGPLGKTFKSFKKIPVSIEIQDKKISIRTSGNRKKEYAIMNTVKSIIRTLCEGVISGYTVKMKIVYSHFPITVKVQNKEVLIENFQGERAARIARIHGQTKVVSKGDEVIITGPVLYEVTQTAAEIEQKTKVKNKDHRVFLDGIYIFSESKSIEK
ncbi:MAG TPA: 50S ribosomal protein L6 [Nitrosopumilaceae archaeon]|nr:50S ribosomal protein L6 [Nitrosopumilaceae archaeon]